MQDYNLNLKWHVYVLLYIKGATFDINLNYSNQLADMENYHTFVKVLFCVLF